MGKRRIEKEWNLDRPRWREALENGRRYQTPRNVDRLMFYDCYSQRNLNISSKIKCKTTLKILIFFQQKSI